MTTSKPLSVVLGRLQALHPKSIDLSLGRLERLLEKLGNPERSTAPVIHVAGTNGKGSTIAYLRAMAEAQGLSVDVYTSPHLIRFNERIRLNGSLISDERLVKCLETCEAINGGEPITFFEITTAAAFLAFADTDADLLLLETGLGGRLDATNVIRRPLLTIITPIGLDHAQFLGTSLPDIAGEKAGIMKPGVPCVIAPQKPFAMSRLLDTAAEKGTPIVQHGVDWIIESGPGFFDLKTADGSKVSYPSPNLIGRHQTQNAATALMGLDTCSDSLTISHSSRCTGLRAAEWPGRLQKLQAGPLRERLGTESELWVDGGHNPDAGQILAEAIRAFSDDRPLFMVLGMMTGKNAIDFLRPLGDQIKALWAVTIPDQENAQNADLLAQQSNDLNIPAHTARSVPAALDNIAIHAEKGRVLIAGSLYLAGHVLQKNGAEIR